MLIFFNSCFALPECEGGPKEISDYSEVKNWSNCKGEITFTKNDGDRFGNHYFGSFVNGKLHGQGTYTWANGGKYVGKWKDGKRHGKGMFTWTDGRKYIGEFEDGKRHGKCTYTYANGDQYVGEYKNDKRRGQGTYYFADGRKYVGEWKNDKYHGQGTFTWPNDKKYNGQWMEGKMFNQIKTISGFILSFEEKCVNTLIVTWNNAENGYWGGKLLNKKFYENKEQYLSYALRQCKER